MSWSTADSVRQAAGCATVIIGTLITVLEHHQAWIDARDLVITRKELTRASASHNSERIDMCTDMQIYIHPIRRGRRDTRAHDEVPTAVG
jgi:hypothetical protein